MNIFKKNGFAKRLFEIVKYNDELYYDAIKDRPYAKDVWTKTNVTHNLDYDNNKPGNSPGAVSTER